MSSKPVRSDPMSLPSREFSSATLQAGLKTLDFQQIKQESSEALDVRMQDV